MADPTPSGPSGQSEQFPQAQSMGANVSLNTSAAQQALADLQKSLENMMKGYGVSWDKSTKDGLAAQEKFYRYVGDKENERRVAVERYKSAAIASIEAQRQATISRYEEEARVGKRTQESLKTASIQATKDASKEAENVQRQASKKLSEDKGIGGTIRSVSSFVGGQVGGSVGGLISGVGSLIAEPEVAIPAAILGTILEIMNKRAAFTKTGAQLAGAGFGFGASQTNGSNFDLGLFKGLNGALSADEQRSIIAGMTGSRTMIGQAQNGGMEAIRGNLGLFANILPDASKEMEIFTDATKSLGMSQKDISSTFMTSRVNSDRLKITQLDAIATQIEMQKALRNITNDGTVAANVLHSVGGFFKDIGKSEAETQRMTLGVARAGANLSLPQMAGMFSFTHGGKMPTEQELFGLNGVGGMMGKGGSGVFGLMGSFLSQVGGQFKDPTQRLFAADALNKQLGLGIQTQDLPQFFNLANKLMTGGIDQKDFSEKVQSLSKHGREITIEGMDTLISVVSPVKQLENAFTNFWTKLDDLFTAHFGKGHSSSFSPISQSMTTKSVKTKATASPHNSDFDVQVH